MKKISILILFLAFTFNSFSQSESLNSDKKLKFGFNMGLNYSNLVFDEATFPTYAHSNTGLGFQLGILADYQFSKYFSVSPRINLTFNDAYFTHSSGLLEDLRYYDVMPVNLEIATYLSVKKEIGKVIPYFFFGPSFKLNTEKQPTTTYTFTTNNDLAIDFGIGLSSRFKQFNFAPELKYSYGLNSLNQNPVLMPFYLHQISLVFNFLG